MKAETYTALLKDLQKLQKSLVQGQIAAVRQSPELTARMTRLHAVAEVGGRLDDFVATAARKSTVLFLLRSVFVRVLEDLGILTVKRIRDDWGFAAFREVAPALGKRAYFAFVFRDLAIDFPALFAPGEDELPLPDEDGCRQLWELWHHPNRVGEHYTWNGEGFESRFLGDLYQDLDADIRKRYALLQTPRFVEEYILDHTLTPALKEFDPTSLREAGETFRLLDPTCGSGHFLIGGFHRLADYWKARGLSEWEACERALESIWGCDINPHAVDIAHFRILLEVVARTGVKDLDRLARLTLNLRAMDSLIPWERARLQAELFPARDRLDSYATPEQRQDNAAFLGRDFHVVVGNPPYITPKDVRKRDDYRVFWPDSAAGKYALSAPFVERIFAIGAAGAFTGQITANSFMKREFGKTLIEKALTRTDLTRIVDTSGAYIPGHGTPTVVIFGRHLVPDPERPIVAVLGKRGEPKRPCDPSQGLVWMALAGSGAQPDDQNPFVTVALLARHVFAKHPWSLGGGQAAAIAGEIKRHGVSKLDRIVESIGVDTITRASDLVELTRADIQRAALGAAPMWPYLVGDEVRDYSLRPTVAIPVPYDDRLDLLPVRNVPSLVRFLWPHRHWLADRFVSGGTRMSDIGLPFHALPQFPREKHATPTSITFAFVATHNHFVLDRGRKVFKQSAPLIKLPATALLEDHLDLLGLLNSSALGFWMKQVLHNKGYGASGDGARTTAQEWENFYEYDSTKLQQAPITSNDRDARIALARALDATAQARAACLPAALLATSDWTPATLADAVAAAHTRYLSLTRTMVALQEELDWLTYHSYGLIDAEAGIEVVGPDAIEPLAPGHRPFEIVHARKDDEADEDEKSAWWSRHGHDRVSEVPEHYAEAHEARLEQRIALIESDPRIALLETPPYKRRWQLADWPAETKKAAEAWLLDRLEDLFAPATDPSSHRPQGPLVAPRPYRLEEITAAWQRDPRVAAVAGLWMGTGLSVDVTLVAEKLLRAHALPDNPHRVYSDEGLRKLGEWKRVWALQDQEDAWERAAALAKERGEPAPKKVLIDPADPSKILDAIPLPAKFERADFAKADYFSIRGKLNVPRERFLLFAELSPQRFGWNGWRDRERALAQVEAFTLAETDPETPLPAPTSDDPRRCGVTFGLWESLPDVLRWDDPEAHAELQALASEACRQSRCPCPIVEAWRARALMPERRARGRTLAAPAEPTVEVIGTPRVEETPEAPATSTEPRRPRTRLDPVTLAERAWVASLLSGENLDASGLWQRHERALAEARKPSSKPAEQLALPGAGAPEQLELPTPRRAKALELAHLTEAHLLAVLDDLVASGDVEATGRGKKKRYLLVSRGVTP